MTGEGGDHAGLSLSNHEMQAVRGEQAVERRQVERLLQVADESLQRGLRKALRDRAGVLGQRRRIPVDRDDARVVAQQVREGDVTPDPTAALALPAAIDWMARQVHGGWAEIMRAN